MTDFPLLEKSIADLQQLMATGKLTALEITQLYLQRIEETDQAGPSVNAVLEINPDALAIATALDSERAQGGPRGPLHGIPILIKDNIETGDKMQTTAGSLALAGTSAAQDAFLVKQLRAAGAIILGKTNLSEWANFRSSRSSSGWSSRGGQTHNPYAWDRNPCGSSSGSGVAVSANFCAAAIGTETDGSVVCPAHANGIVGLKPTIGLISRTGIIPIAHSQDTAGPMTRTVADAALLLNVMSAPDAADGVTQDVARGIDYTQSLRAEGLQGARVGVGRNFFGFHPDVDALLERCLEMMQAAGAVVIDPVNVPTDEYRESEFTVLLYEFKADLDRYLSRRTDSPMNSLTDIIEFNNRQHTAVMPHFGQELMLKAVEKGPLTEEPYLQALAANRRLAGAEGIDQVIATHQLDAIIAPTGGPAWLTDWVNGDHFGGASSGPAAVSGYPNITVPAGFVSGLPVGISFFAGPWQEAKLIELAYAFEQATRARRPPQFFSTLPFGHS